MPTTKSALRKTLLQQRRSFTVEQWQTKSTQICDRLQSLSLLQQAETIFAYFSFRQEPDLAALFTQPKKWAFPRCVDRSLEWHLWQPGETLNRGKYGIFEPMPTAPQIAPAAADLILVPTVAIDNRGYRLGYGGGFYDRLLSQPQCANIPTVAIIFDCALIEAVPIEPWDTKMNFICTETKLKFVE